MHHLVGMAEIAEILGVSRQRVAQLIETYKDFPEPEVELTAGRVWSRTAIETWIAAHPERGPGRSEDKPSVFSFQRFTDRARNAIVKAQEEARLLNHDFIGTEHLLLGLIAIGEGLAFESLKSLGVFLDATREAVVEIIGRGMVTPTAHIPFTSRAKKVLEISLREALSLGHNYVGTEHILLALIREGEGAGWQALAAQGLKKKNTRALVLGVMSGTQRAKAPPGRSDDDVQATLAELKRQIEELQRRLRSD